ncbi:MAG: ammonia-dependent NAD(+) synthetase [Arthrobacter sp.]|uniref:ammonia-dependent NAD(+) synthetase n=1 Tax=Arthrobacter sp. AOP36-C1-22 TaxID=3457683 RepID=UPI00264CA25A|nr:ammonia-dependent NAD(+) synthetase [Micrococcaceae bacterium]MDN5812143.1 ammonia-dependent NAD(+) synthetase [Micrococcaceae bacterium]MDN5823228.1 ammonia-dependent NAD(+) synthetase [Micrococcaceae bacterium]MDN5877967.1 ammonia-dependent NAD(+) synthetase [Micrococcaceae bacterium]MDN5885520.1 ammonia-dependent NAD(+) synthetase [Micrococcaceae bacterium]
MRDMQARIISEMGVKATIDPQEEVTRRVAFLRDYLEATGTRGFVLGISGGLDSTLAGRLAQLAVEAAARDGDDVDFVAVRLPYGTQTDEDDAAAAMEFIAPKTAWTYDIKPGVDALAAEYVKTTSETISDFNKGNIKARLRMTAQYALAGQHGHLVIGTDHAAESVTGFFTKFGDGAADLLPLYGLDKRQNRQLLRHLGASERLWAKPPTADLLDGTPLRTDEDELGLAYDDIDDYLEGRPVPEAVAEAIETRFLRSRHKRTTPVSLLDDWWTRGAD